MDEQNIKLARLEQLLEDNLELAEENNKLLRDMRRAARMGIIFRVLIWAVIIVLPIILLRPYLNALFPITGTESSTGINPLGLPSMSELEDFKQQLEELRAQGG